MRLFKGADLSPTGRIELGSDADNIRVDSKAGRIIIGNGDGALTIVDAATHQIIASVPLKAHPESFQLDADTARIFANVPNARAIDVIDRTSRKKIASWPTAGSQRELRHGAGSSPSTCSSSISPPRGARLVQFAGWQVGGVRSDLRRVDDVFADAKRGRIYLSCGEGFIDVFVENGASYRRTSRMATAGGARTSLFVPELNRLLVAVPARGETSAAIWIFRPP